jgi:rRNA-processing protein FCF1
MRTLIDTNLIIQLEDDHVLEERFSTVYREALQAGKLLIHPRSKEDIERDNDERRKLKTLSKIAKYGALEHPPIPDFTFMESIGAPQRPNDIVDAHLLYAVVKNSVDFLITEDGGIHRKAKRVGIHDRVLTIDQARDLFLSFTQRVSPSVPFLENIPVHNLDLKSHFFGSLRADYGGKAFDDWLEGVSRDGRMCWVHKTDGVLRALCIYKEETTRPDSATIPIPTLKLSTFKVSEDYSGNRTGELMLKMAFRYAITNDLKSIYVTVLPKYPRLISFLEDFGFNVVDTKGEEFVLMKHMVPQTFANTDPVKYAILYYPHHLDGPSIQKFIVPIRPEYHELLFPDCPCALTDGPSSPRPQGNTIKKAYLSESRTKKLNPGDLLLFYRSHDIKTVTSVGVIELAFRSNDPNEIVREVGNRTVYTREEIETMARDGCLVIIFRHVENLTRPVSASVLRDFGMRGNIQSIRLISEELYRKIAGVGK